MLDELGYLFGGVVFCAFLYFRVHRIIIGKVRQCELEQDLAIADETAFVLDMGGETDELHGRNYIIERDSPLSRGVRRREAEEDKNGERGLSLIDKG